MWIDIDTIVFPSARRLLRIEFGQAPLTFTAHNSFGRALMNK